MGRVNLPDSRRSDPLAQSDRGRDSSPDTAEMQENRHLPRQRARAGQAGAGSSQEVSGAVLPSEEPPLPVEISEAETIESRSVAPEDMSHSAAGAPSQERPTVAVTRPKPPLPRLWGAQATAGPFRPATTEERAGNVQALLERLPHLCEPLRSEVAGFELAPEIPGKWFHATPLSIYDAGGRACADCVEQHHPRVLHEFLAADIMLLARGHRITSVSLRGFSSAKYNLAGCGIARVLGTPPLRDLLRFIWVGRQGGRYAFQCCNHASGREDPQGRDIINSNSTARSGCLMPCSETAWRQRRRINRRRFLASEDSRLGHFPRPRPRRRGVGGPNILCPNKCMGLQARGLPLPQLRAAWRRREVRQWERYRENPPWQTPGCLRNGSAQVCPRLIRPITAEGRRPGQRQAVGRLRGE